MKLSNTMKKTGALLAAVAGTLAVHAKTIDSTDAFYSFQSTIDGWASGGLGVGLATTMLVMGGAIGVAKNSPMPALTGVAGAAFLHWGPQIIKTIMISGALL